MQQRIEQRISQWRHAATVLDAERRRRLAELDVDEARRQAEELLLLTPHLPRKSGDIGLVEQQRVFARVRS